MKKFMFSTLLLMALLLTSSFLQSAMAGHAGFSCNSKCKVRCGKAGTVKRCMQFCRMCCNKCKCVPSGTYGNKHECPCYRDWKNKKGKDKCP